MVGKISYVVEMVKDLQINAHRGLAFLASKGDRSLNAKIVFYRLSSKADRQVRTGFDHWLIGVTNPTRYHGWDEPENRDCFVFKWKERNQGNRFYGFLCHPLEQYPGFQLCVLVSHATKNRHKTDPRELKRVNALKIDQAVRKAIAETTKDLRPGKTK
jgi:hypothetical protein